MTCVSRAVSKFVDEALSPGEIEYSIHQGGSEYRVSLDGGTHKKKFRSMIQTLCLHLFFYILPLLPIQKSCNTCKVSFVVSTVYVVRFVKVNEYYILKPRNLTGAQAPLKISLVTP